LQIEIPHIIYSVPSETNYLADVFSRSFNTSRFLDKQKFALSKVQAGKIPPLTEPCVLDEAALYSYFTNSLNSENSDEYPRNKPKISTPKPIKNLYKLFEECTPEEKYYSAIRLLQGWNDPSIKPVVKLNSIHPGLPSYHDDVASMRNNVDQDSLTESTNDNEDPDSSLSTKALALLEQENNALFLHHCNQVIEEAMNVHYKGLDEHQKQRLKNTLTENSKKLLKQNIRSSLKSKFINHEVMLNSLISGADLETKHDQKRSPIYFSRLPQARHYPKIGHSSAEVDLPLQGTLNLDPGESKVIDTGIQFYIPAGYYMQLMPRSSTFKVNLYIHHGVIDNDFNSSVKLLVRNNDSESIQISHGTFLAQGLIVPVIHPHLHEVKSIDLTSNRNNGMMGSSEELMPITLEETPISPIHMLLGQKTPLTYNVPYLNSTVVLPTDATDNVNVSLGISDLHGQFNSYVARDIYPPISGTNCVHSTILDLTRSLVDRSAYLNAVHSDLVPHEHKKIPQIKQELYEDMCKKLAVLSVDLIKNQTITSTMLAKAQQGDDLLSTIRDNIHTDVIRNKGYVIKDQVLYKTFKLPHLNLFKYALCIPDILLPAVVHHLHVILGHPTATTLLKNFRSYYHSPAAQYHIKLYTEACTTCALANKYDIKKVTPSVNRTLKPKRPRQHLYADLIPMFKGTFSYILFALDAYSQFVYAIPLKDKTSASVLQGFLAIFGTTGWYENIYLDNETSFVKAAKMLIKIAPIQVHYSTPYCHFQNSSENYIKNFKKTFLKVLNDQEQPHENSDWPLLLPTVAQAMNRQIISTLGISREMIHHNTTTDFYPLANLTSEVNSELNDQLEVSTLDHFQQILVQRNKRLKYSKKAKAPQFTEKSIVFMRDMTPSTTSNILKIPQKGPFQIKEILERNVVLTDLDTGKVVNTHVELIRPLNIKEFKILLNKKWDLNVHHQKAIDKRSQPGLFDEPLHPVPLENLADPDPIPEIADEIHLEDLFYPPPAKTAPSARPSPKEPLSADQMPAETLKDVEDEFLSEGTTEVAPVLQGIATNAVSNSPSLGQEQLFGMQFNSLHAHRDLSKSFRDSLKTRKEKLITFFLSKQDQYIKTHSGENESDID
jgi:dUTP pyrophosphatase